MTPKRELSHGPDRCVTRGARWKAVRDYAELARETGRETGVGRSATKTRRLAERRAFVDSRLTSS